jgi:hypothetical protein
MSLHLTFEPHSWYMGFAIRTPQTLFFDNEEPAPYWLAYTDDGNTYRVIELHAATLAELRHRIRDWHRRGNGQHIPARLAGYLKKGN